MQPVFIGDVQGCGSELDELLERAGGRFGAAGFEAWLVGDLVNRGPRNHAVLARVRELADAGRARCVLGNHELGLLAAALGIRPVGGSDSIGDLLERDDLDDWIDWVRGLPLVLTGVLGERPFAMVHAAVHPDWTLAELEAAARRVEARLREGGRGPLRRFLASSPADDADRDLLGRLTSCRSVSREDAAWSKLEPGDGRVAWHEAWARRRHDYGIVYGHWAMQGLHVAPGLRGLDTGCVHHGRDHDGFLTAWIPDAKRADPFALPDEDFVQVRAHERYYRDPPTPPVANS